MEKAMERLLRVPRIVECELDRVVPSNQLSFARLSRSKKKDERVCLFDGGWNSRARKNIKSQQHTDRRVRIECDDNSLIVSCK